MKWGKTVVYLGPEGIALCGNCLSACRGHSERVGSEVSAGWGFFLFLKELGHYLGRQVAGGNRSWSPAQARVSSRVCGAAGLVEVDWTQEGWRERDSSCSVSQGADSYDISRRQGPWPGIVWGVRWAGLSAGWPEQQVRYSLLPSPWDWGASLCMHALREESRFPQPFCKLFWFTRQVMESPSWCQTPGLGYPVRGSSGKTAELAELPPSSESLPEVMGHVWVPIRSVSSPFATVTESFSLYLWLLKSPPVVFRSFLKGTVLCVVLVCSWKVMS